MLEKFKLLEEFKDRIQNERRLGRFERPMQAVDIERVVVLFGLDKRRHSSSFA